MNAKQILELDLSQLDDNEVSVLRARVDTEYLDRSTGRARSELVRARALTQRAEKILAAYEAKESS